MLFLVKLAASEATSTSRIALSAAEKFSRATWRFDIAEFNRDSAAQSVTRLVVSELIAALTEVNAVNADAAVDTATLRAVEPAAASPSAASVP